MLWMPSYMNDGTNKGMPTSAFHTNLKPGKAPAFRWVISWMNSPARYNASTATMPARIANGSVVVPIASANAA